LEAVGEHSPLPCLYLDKGLFLPIPFPLVIANLPQRHWKRFEAKGGPFQVCSLRVATANKVVMTRTSGKKKVGQEHVLNQKKIGKIIFFLRWHSLGHLSSEFSTHSCRDNSVGGHWELASFQCPQTSSNGLHLQSFRLGFYHLWD